MYFLTVVEELIIIILANIAGIVDINVRSSEVEHSGFVF